MRDQHLDEVVQKMDESFPDFDHSIMRMIAAIANTYHILLSVMERAFSAYGITPQSMDVLVALYVNREQGCPLGEISERLMVSPANVTGLVDGLVKKGLASRREHPEDRRKRLATITPRGIELMEAFIPESARFFEEVFADLSQEDKLQLYDRLGQVSRRLLPYWERRRVADLQRSTPRKQVAGRS